VKADKHPTSEEQSVTIHPRGDSPTRFRRLSILDMMIAIIAFALAFVVARGRFHTMGSAAPLKHVTITAIYAVANSVLMALTMAPTVILLRRPRPRLRVLLRRPGPAACLASLAGIVVTAARTFLKIDSMMSMTEPGSFKSILTPGSDWWGSFASWISTTLF